MTRGGMDVDVKCACRQCGEAVLATPRLSIVTICYNNAEGLRQTLESTLRRQNGFTDFEQIVVDGGSSDSTMDVIREYQDKLVWWCSEPDRGIYNAMNKGAEHATGEYLLFLNSGDVVFEDAFEKIFANGFDEDLVYADIYTTDGKTKWLIKSPSQTELTPAYLTINTLPHQATLIRRELHEALGGYDESMKISAAPKFIMDALLLRKCSTRYLEIAYSVFDRSGISSDIRRLPEKLREWQYFMRPHFGDRVANAFYRAKMSETIISKHVIEYISQHPEKIPEVRMLFDAVVYKAKHGMDSQQVNMLEKDLLAKDASSTRRISELTAEVAALKRSFAYRSGMLLTWPLRKLYRMLWRIKRK